MIFLLIITCLALNLVAENRLVGLVQVGQDFSPQFLMKDVLSLLTMEWALSPVAVEKRGDLQMTPNTHQLDLDPRSRVTEPVLWTGITEIPCGDIVIVPGAVREVCVEPGSEAEEDFAFSVAGESGFGDFDVHVGIVC